MKQCLRYMDSISSHCAGDSNDNNNDDDDKIVDKNTQLQVEYASSSLRLKRC